VKIGTDLGKPSSATSATRRSSTTPTTRSATSSRRGRRRLLREGKRYDTWESKYRCKELEQYYEGFQWHGLSEEEARRKYVINMVFATVETQLPTLLFSRPKVKVEPRPDRQESAGSQSGARATLIEQTIQTQLDDPKVHFTEETELALHDAYSRFGIVEVGYDADWIANPNAGKPVLKDDSDDPLLDKDDQPVLQPEKMLAPGSKESVYIRRLNPDDVRVSPGRNILEQNDWVAYAEWHDVNDIKKNPAYMNTAGLKSTGSVAPKGEEADGSITTDPDHDRHSGQVRLWTIFDLRTKTKHVVVDGHKDMIQMNRPFGAELPLADIKFFERRNQYYPLPPIFNWMSPQDELNESREMQKVHRRRAVRRYMREPSVKREEFEKLESGEDMVSIEVPKTNPPPIVPVADAPLDGSNWTELAATKEDFAIVSGVGGEARGAPQSKTATQANIINVRAELRESRARTQVALWLGAICRKLLVVMREKVKLPFMVKQSIDPFSPSAAAMLQKAELWLEIKSEDVSDLDVDVKIDVDSLSPIAEQQAAQQWDGWLALMTNPPLLMILFTANPEAPQEPTPMLRKTLAFKGIKSDNEVREIWRVGQVVLQQMQMMTLATAASKGGMPGLGMMLGGGGGPSMLEAPKRPAGTPSAGVQH
jgi:hypothetical protein